MNKDQFNKKLNEMTDDELLQWAAKKVKFTYKSYILFFCVIISFMAYIYYII